MRMRAERKKRWPGFVLAFLVFWGTSGQAVSAVFCGAQNCGRTAMAAPQPAPEPGDGCCSGMKASPKPAKAPGDNDKEGCCCKVESAKDFTFAPAQLPVISVAELPLLGPPSAPNALLTPRMAAEPIHFYSDSSPPTVAAGPDRGRAPPSA